MLKVMASNISCYDFCFCQKNWLALFLLVKYILLDEQIILFIEIEQLKN